MRTTIDIDERVLKDVVKLTGEKRKGKAVNHALKEFVRQQRLRELADMIGKVKLVDNWRELEELELQEMETMDRIGKRESA